MGNINRKRAILFIILLMVMIIGSGSASSSFSIWPGKLTITMNEDFPNEEIYYTFEINNNNPYDVNITMQVMNPVSDLAKEGYTNIPDFSWIKINQSIVNINAGETKFVDVYLDIPDSQKQSSYNKNWEFWIKVYESPDKDVGAGTSILTAIALKIFIDTPKKEQIQNDGFFVFFFFCIIIIISIIYIYIRRMAILKFTKKHGIFYFKKNKNI